MLTDDIRLERLEDEYQTVRSTQNKLMDSMNGLGGFLENLSRDVRANHEAIEENRRAIEDNRRAIEQNREELTLLRQALAENSQLLADVAEHLQVPRRRIGFNPE